MNDPLEHITATVRTVALSNGEKERTRHALISFMRAHPAHSGTHETHRSVSGMFVFLLPYAQPLSAALLIVLVIGGGVSIAAEGALPGEMLYPMKVGVNEEVLGWFAGSPLERAEWEASRATRRLEEIERLAAKGDTVHIAYVEARFDAHADAVQRVVFAFEQEGDSRSAAEISSHFETTLGAHKEILGVLAKKDVAGGRGVGPILASVEVRSGTAARSREESEAHISFADGADNMSMRASGEAPAVSSAQAPSAHPRVASSAGNSYNAEIAEQKKIYAEKSMTAIRAYRKEHAEELGAEAQTQLNVRLKAAQAALEEGRASMDAEAYGAAFNHFQKAERLIRQGALLLGAQKALELTIDLSAGVSNEDAQPKHSDDGDVSVDSVPEDDGVTGGIQFNSGEKIQIER